ncbi:unnamed protein product [Cuscuta campestris]|uniref:Uncharacterized protein n=1 Tax=Cuscuta campestris TaxID=132261 RepID=A0A484LY71_9ASTE|nr:unnamed protein product [Cuscuta campestris]
MKKMKSLRTTGVALSVVFGCLLFALLAELYYLLWWRRRITRRGIEDGPGKNLFYFFFLCRKKKQSPPPPPPPPPVPSSPDPGVSVPKPQEEEMDSELLRLAGPPRFLFTIKEETREDLESQDRRKPRRRLSDVLFLQEDGDVDNYAHSTPYFTPPLTPLNPLFEPSNGFGFTPILGGGPSPPPTFKFLRDAEEKLFKRKILEAEEAQRFPKKMDVSAQVDDGDEEERGENGSFIRLICPRRREEEIENVSASQVLPLPSDSPSN